MGVSRGTREPVFERELIYNCVVIGDGPAHSTSYPLFFLFFFLENKSQGKGIKKEKNKKIRIILT